MSASFLRFMLVASLLAAVAGCGSGLVRVQGEVLLDDKPLPNAKIMLMPESGGRPVTGTSDAQGKFQLTTSHPGDGAPPGNYKVSVTASQVDYIPKPGSEAGYSEKVTWLAPQRYSDINQSGLTATISAQEPTVKLQLQTAPK